MSVANETENRLWNRLKGKKKPAKPKEPPAAMVGKGMANKTAMELKKRKAIIDAMTE